jgi:hypothetical protein
MTTSRSSTPDSLFDELSPSASATRTTPPIPGLFFDPTILLPSDQCIALFAACTEAFFPSSSTRGSNQVMLFGERMFPPFLIGILSELEVLLRTVLPPDVHVLLFPSTMQDGHSKQRQAIVNRYEPGEGITPHIDLLGRYDDGIIGISTGSGCSMVFQHETTGKRHEMYLPVGSVLVLTGEARYKWTHGIERLVEDVVQNEGEDEEFEVIKRDERISVTFRWLLPDALVVGGP